MEDKTKFECRDECENNAQCTSFSMSLYGDAIECCLWSHLRCSAELLSDTGMKHEYYRVRIDDTDLDFTISTNNDITTTGKRC